MSRDCRKRIAKETKGETTAPYKQTRVTAASVTFDADDDDETESVPDDETSTLFQAVIILESDNEDMASDTSDPGALDPDTETHSPASDANTETQTKRKR